MSDDNKWINEGYFIHSRYNKQIILDSFEKIGTIDKMFRLDIAENDDIEVNVHKGVGRDFIKEVSLVVYEKQDITEELAHRINPDRDLQEVHRELKKMGYTKG